LREGIHWAGLFDDFSLQNFVRAFDPSVDENPPRFHLLRPALATAICLLLGYPVAFFIARAPERWRGLLLMLVMVPFWTNFLIRTSAWITIPSKEGIVNSLLMSAGISSEPAGLLYSPFAIVLGLVDNFLPFHDPADLHERGKAGPVDDRGRLRTSEPGL
jgi:spermidine/putrescine transport system permease protein